MLLNKIKLAIRHHFIFIVLLLSVIVFHDPSSGVSNPKITYNLELDEEKWNSFKINITIENNVHSQLLCVLPDLIPGIYKRYSFSDNLVDFEVVGGGEKDPEITKLNKNSWLLDTDDNNLIVISYTIKNPFDPLFGLCIDQNFAWINSRSVFLFIREYSKIPIDLRLNVPNGWKLATGLIPKTDFFYYQAWNYQHLANNPLYMGPFEDSYFNLDDQAHFVIVHGTYPYSMGKLGVTARKIIGYQSDFFKSELKDEYNFIFKLFPIKKKTTCQAFEKLSMIHSSNEAVRQNLTSVGKKVASSFFKRWIKEDLFIHSQCELPLSFAPRSALLWFPYGLSEYYGSLTMIRTELWKEQEFIDYYIQRYNEFLRNEKYSSTSLTNLSYNLAESDYTDVLDYLSLKSEIIALLMDLKIRSMTDNQKSLDDMIIFLKYWYIDQGRQIKHQDLIVLMKSLFGTDFRDFFDLYIYGSLELPFIEMFRDVGIILNSKIDTLPIMDEYIKMNDKNKVIRLGKNSQLSNAGLKIGDRIISINNQKVYGQFHLIEIIDSLKIGSAVELMIERNKLNLMLLFQVVGGEAKQVELKNVIMNTDSMKINRGSWLSGKY